MNLTTDTSTLKNAIATVARNLPNRPATPALAGIKITATNGTLTLNSFDYENSATITIPANVSEEGEVITHGKTLAGITQSLSNNDVTSLRIEENKLHVLCKAAKFQLSLMPRVDYPMLPTTPPVLGTVDSTEFASAVSCIANAAATDETLPILVAVRIRLTEDSITFCATDRYRLHQTTIEWVPTQEFKGERILLAKARILEEVARNLTDGTNLNIGASSDDGLIAFSNESAHITTTAVAGEYPKVDALFPTTFKARAVVKTNELAQAAKRVKLVAERNSPIRLTFDGPNNSIRLDAGTADASATASDQVYTVVSGDVETFTLAFNPVFLADALAAVTTSFAQFDFVDSGKPTTIRPQVEPDQEPLEDSKFLLMPVRTPNEQ